MMISLSNINAEDWSHPTSEYGTTAYSSVTEIWSDGPVFKIGINTITPPSPFKHSHQEINLVYKGVIEDTSYKTAGNDAVTWKEFPAALHSSGEATCNVGNNEIVVGYKCVDTNCGVVRIGCLVFVEGLVGTNISTVELQNSVSDKLECPDNQYMVGLECSALNCLSKKLKCAEISVRARDSDDPVPGDSGPPRVFGDPHFAAFNGQSFSYHGECDLVLFKSPKFGSNIGFEVHIRTTRVENERVKYSYISGVAVSLDDGVVLEVSSSDGKLLVNGEPCNHTTDNTSSTGNGEPPTKAILTEKAYELRKLLSGSKGQIVQYVLKFHGGRSIEIRANTRANMISTSMNGTWSNTTGMLGSSGNARFMSRDGSFDSAGSWNTHAEEWQVNTSDRKIFLEDREPQFPHACRYEVSQMKQKALRGRRLMDKSTDRITDDMARSACAHVKKDEMKKFCIFDVLATEDVELSNDPAYN
jgi:hypothetical protein